jgi:hypothetical protein
MHLKDGRSAENFAYSWKGTTSRGPKLVFDQMTAPAPEIMYKCTVTITY